MRYNINLTGISITDELINRSTSDALPLYHDTVLDDGSFQIWTDAAGTGTQLNAGTDYTLSTLDTRLTDLAGEDVYQRLAIVNGVYQGIPLYVSYKTAGDYTSADSINQALMIGEYRHLDLDDEAMAGFTLPVGWVRADGQLVDDLQSPWNGRRVHNVNGADVVLTLTWTADALGSYATVDAADLPALSVGDWVAGSGIAAEAMIQDITGTTVTITDTAATGSIASTFNNDGLYLGGGPVSGVTLADQMQRVTGSVEQVRMGGAGSSTVSGAIDVTVLGPYSYSGFSDSSGGSNRNNISFDSAGSPRARTSSSTAGRTRPHTLKLVSVVRIK